jgi:hypothetical protein
LFDVIGVTYGIQCAATPIHVMKAILFDFSWFHLTFNIAYVHLFAEIRGVSKGGGYGVQTFKPPFAWL